MRESKREAPKTRKKKEMKKESIKKVISTTFKNVDVDVEVLIYFHNEEIAIRNQVNGTTNWAHVRTHFTTHETRGVKQFGLTDDVFEATSKEWKQALAELLVVVNSALAEDGVDLNTRGHLRGATKAMMKYNKNEIHNRFEHNTVGGITMTISKLGAVAEAEAEYAEFQEQWKALQQRWEDRKAMAIEEFKRQVAESGMRVKRAEIEIDGGYVYEVTYHADYAQRFGADSRKAYEARLLNSDYGYGEDPEAIQPNRTDYPTNAEIAAAAAAADDFNYEVMV